MNLPISNYFMSGLAALALWQSNAAGQSFSAEGILGHRSYIQDMAGEETQYKVTIHVKSPQWQIRIEPLAGNGTNGTVSSCTAGYDGEAFYVVSAGNTMENQQFNGPQDASPMPVACVGLDFTGIISPQMGAAFVCFSFVPDVRNNLLTGNKGTCIWHDPLLIRHRVKFDVTTQTHPAQSLVEKTVVWQNDGRVRFENDSRELLKKAWPPPYDKGYTNAVYTATFTNMSGTLMPLAATLVTFIPDLVANGGNGKLLTDEIYSMRISHIFPSCQITEFKPELPPMTRVIDLRWINQDPQFCPTSVVTNGGPWKIVSMDELANEYGVFSNQNQLRHSGTLWTGHQIRISRQIIVVTIVMLGILVGIVIKRKLI
jgi:hypothetical protein